MPTGTTITAQESAPPVDPGTYDAIVEDITVEDGQFGPQYKFVFELVGQTKDDGSPIKQWGWASQTLTPLSKLFKWVSAIDGKMPPMGVAFDIDSMIGKSCQVFVNNVDGPTGPKLKIVDVLGPKKRAAAAPPAAARPATETICAVKGCGGEVDKYTSSGTALCVGHTADDL